MQNPCGHFGLSACTEPSKDDMASYILYHIFANRLCLWAPSAFSGDQMLTVAKTKQGLWFQHQKFSRWLRRLRWKRGVHIKPINSYSILLVHTVILTREQEGRHTDGWVEVKCVKKTLVTHTYSQEPLLLPSSPSLLCSARRMAFSLGAQRLTPSPFPVPSERVYFIRIYIKISPILSVFTLSFLPIHSCVPEKHLPFLTPVLSQSKPYKMWAALENDGSHCLRSTR